MWVDHDISEQGGGDIEPFVDWDCDLMFKVFVALLDASDFDEDLAWTIAPDDQDVALGAFHFDIFSLVEGET